MMCYDLVWMEYCTVLRLLFFVLRSSFFVLLFFFLQSMIRNDRLRSTSLTKMEAGCCLLCLLRVLVPYQSANLLPIDKFLAVGCIARWRLADAASTEESIGSI